MLGFPVACGSPALPQIAIKPAGKDKSSASTGVRKQIYDWLAANAPKSGYDGTPLHDALKTSYNYLRLSAAKTKLIAVVITDGSPSCASLSTRGGYTDINGCQDWEYPASLIKLIKDAHDDKALPVQTFVVGVPGSDTVGADKNTQPPWSISLRALSVVREGLGLPRRSTGLGGGDGELASAPSELLLAPQPERKATRRNRRITSPPSCNPRRCSPCRPSVPSRSCTSGQ